MMAYPCELKEQPVQPALSVHTRTPVQNLPLVLGMAFGAIMQHLGSLKENPTGAPFVAYYNMDMQDLDIEIGFPVARSLSGNGQVQPGQIPAGKYASCLYTGPYADCNPAYEALSAWIRKNGYEATGTAYEFYLNDPQTTPQQNLQTLISLPVRGK
jgi:effector-binding domain-containing protein